MQLPLTEAHEYHTPDTAVSASSRYVHHHITKTYNLNSLHLQGKRYQCMPKKVMSKLLMTQRGATHHSVTVALSEFQYSFMVGIVW